MARTNCLACGKINSDGRERCMYCESYLAGSMPAPPEVPEYLRRKPRRFPWLWILAILGAAGCPGLDLRGRDHLPAMWRNEPPVSSATDLIHAGSTSALAPVDSPMQIA
jgi:hypothetical protein